MKKVCKYCIIYNESSERENKIEKRGKREKDIHLRYCKIKKEQIEYNTIACDKFETTKYFYCTKKNERILLKLCILRREKKTEGCQRCKQGKLIEDTYNE